METPRYARSATAILARAAKMRADAEPLSGHDGGARRLAIAAIERAIVDRARARRVWRIAGISAAAATVALAVGVAAALARASSGSSLVATAALAGERAPGVLHTQGDGVMVMGPRAEAQGEEGATVGQGSRLVVRPQGRALLSFATGTELTLEERGDLTLVDEGAMQRFALGGGSVQAKVAKLAPGHRFVVATSDAEIEVRGTSFRVSVVPPDPSCGDGTPTRVDVVEGVVVVRHGGVEARVGAGERWPAGCEATRATAKVEPAQANALHPASASALAQADAKDPNASVKKAPAPSAAPSSRLGDQNDLFAEAFAAKRRGAGAAAAALFERFLARYPSSPLAESAMAERMKLVRSRALAQAYLSRYPNGFARSDASAILAESP